MFAAIDGRLKMVKYLIRHGAQLNIFDADGKSPLDYARQFEHQEIEALLRLYGAK
jgi:ankyrin repeat protein